MQKVWLLLLLLGNGRGLLFMARWEEVGVRHLHWEEVKRILTIMIYNFNNNVDLINYSCEEFSKK